MKNLRTAFRNEDWMATIMGLLMATVIIVAPNFIPKFPTTLSTG